MAVIVGEKSRGDSVSFIGIAGKKSIRLRSSDAIVRKIREMNKKMTCLVGLGRQHKGLHNSTHPVGLGYQRKENLKLPRED